ncbi:neuronal acetylcholine receptor subunit alpha-3-like [Mizuhopecten yessoensis]|uniref:Neuronal acetylcholine receptor subunit alpha-7 n=1 Tax=Mizuhopecten yessoensis TaxID=6573 RepID=A0A210PR74_MIZYE|nr:neuronal acetylcholine receptor subunit alpha-3-like [Mizuhopecten yessoensis]OWF38995.1 Neuronal acetylcholine receptor subunit alpha-7 [Mizuhopecten yessoensis]
MDNKLYMTILLLSCLQVAEFAVSTIQKDIYNNIIAGYTKEVRPVSTGSIPMNIEISGYLMAINDFDEVSGTLEIVIVVGMKWTDEALVWDLATYNYTGYITIPQSKIWVPEIFDLKAADTFEAIGGGNFKVLVVYSGEVQMMPGGIMKIKCTPDVAKFPFDVQNCYLEITPWMYIATDIMLSAGASELDMTYYEANGEWTVLETGLRSQPKGVYSTLIISFKMKRIPLYHIVNTLIPIYFLGFLNPLVFILPCDCGERSGFTLTMLLSYTVFMMIINAALPQTSSPMAVLSFVTFGALVFSGLITILNCFQLRMFHRDENVPVPNWLVKLIACLTCYGRAKVKPDVVMNGENDENSGPIGIKDGGTVTWQRVVEVMDMFYLSSIYITGVIGTVVITVYLTSM